MSLRLAFVFVAVGLAACSSESAVTSDGELIGGTDVKNAEIPATVGISLQGKHGCTAAHVGDRFLLTAAHCVLNLSTLDMRYDATHAVTIAGTARAVKTTHVHPVWMERCAETLCSVAAVTAKLDAPDVAVLELEAPLEGIPIAPIETRALVPGDDVTIVGYGCTKGVHVGDDRPTPTLLSAAQEIVPASTALHEGSYVENEDFAGNYVLSGGRAGLCPGDSGGPLYVRRDGRLAVAGVNANYTLRPDEEDAIGVPVTNWHTRLDSDSRNHVDRWLTDIGVTAR